MHHRMELDLPEDVYSSLQEAARRAGRPPEGLAVAWLSAVRHHALNDPLEQFIGAIPTSVPDWAARHDEFLGQSLADELKGESGSGT